MSKQYGDFPISKLVTVKTIKHKLSKADFVENGEYPCYSSDTNNNGILGYTNNPEFIVSESNPCYLIFGDHTRTINIAYKSFSVLDNTKVLIPPTDNEKALLYMICVWKKQIPNIGYARHWSLAKECMLKLPLVSGTNDNIDYEYMEFYISKLEQERIKKMDNFLKVAGLDDYELTDDDNEILNKKIQHKGFELNKIFTSQNGDTDLKQIHINGLGTPVASSGEYNQGIIGDTDKNAKIIKENTITADMFGNVFFRDFKYKMVTHARVFSLECVDSVSNEAQLYLVSRLKYLKTVYSYQNMCSWNKIQSNEISLPTSDGINPDYEYMKQYIKVQEKLVIKDVVLMKNRIIKKDETIVNK